jgi:hypothetical protein
MRYPAGEKLEIILSNGKEPGPRIGIQSGPLSGVGSGLSR